MKTQKILHMIAFTLLVVGGVNWGAVGLFDYDLVQLMLGELPEQIGNSVYALIGVSAVYIAATHLSDCKTCSSK